MGKTLNTGELSNLISINNNDIEIINNLDVYGNYKLSGTTVFLNSLISGNTGNSGYILLSTGLNSTPIWSSINSAGISPLSGSSSLVTVGTITGGTWNSNLISSTYGGTGINNAGRTFTINTNSGTISYTNASTTLTVANNASVAGTNTGDQTITLSGDITTAAMTNGTYAATLPNIASAGTYNTVVVNAKGQVTSGTSYSYSLSTHNHYQLYQPNGSNPFVYTDNSGALHIDGNIIQSGSSYTIHAQDVYTTGNTITLRDGAIAGLSGGQYVGFIAKLYDGANDGQLVFDNTGTARVGDVGSLQPIATRTETPSNGYIAYWEAASTRLNFKQLTYSDISNIGSYTGNTNITTLGTVTTGTWNGTIIASQYGGTGINNGGRTLTISTNSGTLLFSGAGTTLTIGAAASVAGTNTGDVTLATNHGLSLSGQVIGMGTPSHINASSTNSVTTTTHTHAVSGLTTSNLSATAGIVNTQLANSSITVGSTAISLGASATTIAGLVSLTSTTLVGALTGNASTATTLQNARTIAISGVVTGTATSFNGSANISIPVTAVAASGLTGTIPSAVLANSTVYIGTTAIALNRASAALVLTGITSIDGTATPNNDSNLVHKTGAETITGIKTFSTSNTSATISNTTGDLAYLSAYNNNDGAAMMTFHNAGRYAVNFGLDTDGILKVGGWSMGANAYTIWHSGNDSSLAHLAGSETFTGNKTFNGGLTMGVSQVLNHNTTSSRDKIRVWDSSIYTIGMKNGYTFGGMAGGYAMTFQMASSAQPTWGFWWGSSTHTDAQGAMALTITGKLALASGIKVGYGETSTVAPTANQVDVNGGLKTSDGTNACEMKYNTTSKTLDFIFS